MQAIRNAIANGDMLQVKLTRREDAPFGGDAWSLYEDRVAAHPAPFCAFLEAPGLTPIRPANGMKRSRRVHGC